MTSRASTRTITNIIFSTSGSMMISRIATVPFEFTSIASYQSNIRKKNMAIAAQIIIHFPLGTIAAFGV